MKTPTVITERLVLRPFVDGDVVELHRILNQDEVLKSSPGPGSPSLEKAQKFVARQIKQWDEIGYAWWAVESTEAGLAGIEFGFETVGLKEVIARAHPGNLASQGVIGKVGLSFVEGTEYFDMAVRGFVLDAETYRGSTTAT